VRQLFAHSGNRCAFDPCDQPLIDSWANFIGQVCHIRAALPGGERFDAKMTNEQRRSPSNLLLMCHPHHVRTNDEGRFDVAAMEAIKRAHEARFAAASPALSEAQVDQAVEYFVESSIVDRTYETPYRVPLSCARINAVNGWGVTEDQAAGTAAEVAQYVKNLRRVPVDARAVLAAAVDRGSASGGVMDYRVYCLLADVALATGTSDEELRVFAAVLEKWGIGQIDRDFDDIGMEYLAIGRHDLGWNIWEETKNFADATNQSVRAFAVELRFDLFDGDEPSSAASAGP
jgi:hypothetical protein